MVKGFVVVVVVLVVLQLVYNMTKDKIRLCSSRDQPLLL